MLLLVVAIAAFGYGVRGLPRQPWVIASAVWVLVALLAMLTNGWPVGLIIPGLLVPALTSVVPTLLGAYLRRQRDYREKGWQLADALERERAGAMREAQAAERARIATEMHDTLGHEMTLIAVQAGALEVREGSDAALRGELGDLRRAAATATDRLQAIVGMLSSETAPSLDPSDDDLEMLVRRAHEAGMSVDSTLTLEKPLEPLAARAFHRLVEEALTNAARHAPGAEVEIVLSQNEQETNVRVIDSGPPVSPVVEPADAGSRRGLVGLAERFRVLGGTFDAGPVGDGFALTGSLPHRPVVQSSRASAEASRSGTARDEARDRQRRSLRRAVLVPAGLILAAAVVGAGYFTFNTIASVLPAERFAEISVGMPQTEAERLLPPVQMIDAPPAVRPDGECRFYEAEMSFFDRRDVYQICFAGDRVASTTTIGARR